MSYQLSDEDTTDSDSGIRFKTTNTRNKLGESSSKTVKKSAREKSPYSAYSSHRHSNSSKSRDRSRSRDSRRDRSTSKDHRSYRKNSHKSRTPDRHRKSNDCKKHKHYSRKNEKHKSRSYEREDDRHTHIKNDRYIDTAKYGPVLSKEKRNSGSDSEQIGPSIGDKCESEKQVTVNELGPKLAAPIEKSDKYCENSDSSESDNFGPALPSTLKTTEELSKNVDTKTYGPQLPQIIKNNDKDIEKIQTNKDNFCPVLPPKVSISEETQPANLEDNDDDMIGPALPPHLIKTKPEKESELKQKIIGPYIPEHLRSSLFDQPDVFAAPSQLETIESDSEDDCIGPLPAGHIGTSTAHIKLEERALQMKIDGLSASDEKGIVREEWMLELPEVHKANLGLGPRQFRSKAGPDMSDRSSWTDTPQDKLMKASGKTEKKIDLKKEAELRHIRERDIEQQKIIEKHKKKKKRDKSLLDLHQDEQKKKKKDEPSSSERRPFNRDIDLKANRFDEAQKKAILKKAQLLDNRFSSGESKFL